MVLVHDGQGRHAFRHLPEIDGGYFNLASTLRNVIGVTGACLMTKRETFRRLGGFDEAHAIINNDLDFCIRAHRSGLLNVFTPYARLIHHELVSRSGLPESHDAEKFRKFVQSIALSGDPYFNLNLSRDQEPFSIEREPVEVIHAGHPLYEKREIRRILVLKLDHIGDCITALLALRLLKSHHPTASIAILAASAGLPIWHSEPVVDDVIEFNFFHTRSGLGKVNVTETQQRELSELLFTRNFDLAIDLRKQPDTRHILQWTGARILAGFDHQGRFPWLDIALEWDEDVPLRGKRSHICDELIGLVDAVANQGNTDRSEVLVPKPVDTRLTVATKRLLAVNRYVCVHPAAGSPMRQWPPRKFSELIDLLIERNGLKVVLVGSSADRAITDEVLRETRNKRGVLDLAGKLGLIEFESLVAASFAFIGNNSGPQHIAAAIGTPTIGIHSGVVDAREWGPMGKQAIALRRDMSCSPCYLERPADCPRNLACLAQLHVTDVYRHVDDFLGSPRLGAKGAQMPRRAGDRQSAIRVAEHGGH
jgi:ADP-heptose:LPS heptosyltransferase